MLITESVENVFEWPLLSHLCPPHRSKSVVRIYSNVRFEPSKVNIFVKDCQRGGKDVTCMSAIVCLNITARTAFPPTQEIGKPAKTIICKDSICRVSHFLLFFPSVSFVQAEEGPFYQEFIFYCNLVNQKLKVILNYITIRLVSPVNFFIGCMINKCIVDYNSNIIVSNGE